PILEWLPGSLGTSRRQATVYHQDVAGDESGLFGGEKPHRSGNILRLAQPSCRGPADDLLQLRGVETVRHLGAEISRCDRIDGDAATAQFPRERAGEAVECSFGR